MSSESGSILKFEAALEDHHTSIRLMPEKSIEVLELKVVFPYVFEKKDSILMNGYQSWTVLKEYSLDTTNVMAEQVAKIMRHKKTDNCGDREFTNYEKENRWLHGVSYGYIRRGSEFYFFGSLNEQQGFTFFDINTKDNTLTVRKELQTRFFDQEFTALDIIFLKGTEDEVFDQ